MEYPFSTPNGYEEALNQQVVGYLYYSLQIDVTLINSIHENQSFSFSDEAQLVAHQDSPLPQYTESGTDREIDWVVSDETKLVGYESKYGDSLDEGQLADELAKLRLNADDQDIKLVTITPHITRPSTLEEFDDEPVYWLSWYEVSRQLRRTNAIDVPTEQRSILRMLQDLMEAEDMHPFTGFDHEEKFQYQYFIRNLRQELVGSEIKNRNNVHTWTTTKPDSSEWKMLVPQYLDIPFVHESRDEDSGTKRGSYLAVVVDTRTNDVHTGIVFNVRRVSVHQDYIDNRVDDIVEYATENEVDLWAAMNSLQGNSRMRKTGDPTVMRTWLEEGGKDAIEVDENRYKKAFLMRECSASDPTTLVQEVKDELLRLTDRFLIADDLYPWPTLADQN
jgi:hypothetical protein